MVRGNSRAYVQIRIWSSLGRREKQWKVAMLWNRYVLFYRMRSEYVGCVTGGSVNVRILE
jgi:hypothetical protein